MKIKSLFFFGAELNFRISCIGVSGNMTSEITAVVYDAFAVKARLKDAIKADNPNDPQAGKCKDLQGEELFQCLCEDQPDSAAEQRCIDEKRKALQNPQNPDQGKKDEQQLQPGPPKVIFLQVK